MTKRKKAARMTFCLPIPLKVWLSEVSEETQIPEAEHLRRAIHCYRIQLSKEMEWQNQPQTPVHFSNLREEKS